MGKLRFKIFFVILVTLFVFNFSVSAEKRKVKVAFVPIEGMQEIDTNGNPKGYMYEYFNQLASRF